VPEISSKNLTEAFAILDANNENVDWTAISNGLTCWKISIGSRTPEFCDELEVSKRDVMLLLRQAKFMVADDRRYKDLANKMDIPFVLVKESSDIQEVQERIDDCWNSRARAR